MSTSHIGLAKFMKTFSKVYENNILGLHGVWGRFAGVITQLSDGGTPCKHYSIVPMPTSISPDAKLAPAHLVSSNSRLAESTGFSLKAIGELTRMLLATLNRDFGIACSPEGNLVREQIVAGHAKGPIGKILLIGASNMRRLSSLLTSMGYTVDMISLAGGVPSDSALEQLKKDVLDKNPGGDSAMVFDLFGNFTYRFVQADGSLALPIMLGGKYHLLGDLAVVQEGTFKGVVSKSLEILGLQKECLKIVLPPIPRYLKGILL